MAYIPSSAPTIYSNSPEMTQPTLVWDASRTTSSQSQPPALSFVNISANYPEHAVGVSGGNGSLQERPLQLSHTSGTKIRLSHAAPTALSQVTGNISAYQQRAAPLHSANPSANGQYTSGEGTELDTNLEAPFSHRAAPFHDISDALEGYHATAAPRRSPTPSSAYGSDETTENNISPSSPLDLHKPTSSSSSTPASNGTHKPSFIEPTDQSPDKSSLQPEHGSFSPPKDSSSTANNLLLLSSLQPSPPLGIAERRPRRAKTASKLAGKTGPVRTHAATKIPVNLLPTLYEDLLKKLSDEGIDGVDKYAIQSLVINSSVLGDEPEPAGEVESRYNALFEECIDTVNADTQSRYKMAARRKNGRIDVGDNSDLNRDKQVIERYHELLDSNKYRVERLYRNSEAAVHYVWTREDFLRFKEAFRKFGYAPTANRQIADYVGKGMHPNHIQYFKRALKQRLGGSMIRDLIESEAYDALIAAAPADDGRGIADYLPPQEDATVDAGTKVLFGSAVGGSFFRPSSSIPTSAPSPVSSSTSTSLPSAIPGAVPAPAAPKRRGRPPKPKPPIDPSISPSAVLLPGAPAAHLPATSIYASDPLNSAHLAQVQSAPKPGGSMTPQSSFPITDYPSSAPLLSAPSTTMLNATNRDAFGIGAQPSPSGAVLQPNVRMSNTSVGPPSSQLRSYVNMSAAQPSSLSINSMAVDSPAHPNTRSANQPLNQLQTHNNKPSSASLSTSETSRPSQGHDRAFLEEMAAFGLTEDDFRPMNCGANVAAQSKGSSIQSPPNQTAHQTSSVSTNNMHLSANHQPIQPMQYLNNEVQVGPRESASGKRPASAMTSVQVNGDSASQTQQGVRGVAHPYAPAGEPPTKRHAGPEAFPSVAYPSQSSAGLPLPSSQPDQSRSTHPYLQQQRPGPPQSQQPQVPQTSPGMWNAPAPQNAATSYPPFPSTNSSGPTEQSAPSLGTPSGFGAPQAPNVMGSDTNAVISRLVQQTAELQQALFQLTRQQPAGNQAQSNYPASIQAQQYQQPQHGLQPSQGMGGGQGPGAAPNNSNPSGPYPSQFASSQPPQHAQQPSFQGMDGIGAPSQYHGSQTSRMPVPPGSQNMYLGGLQNPRSPTSQSYSTQHGAYSQMNPQEVPSQPISNAGFAWNEAVPSFPATVSMGDSFRSGMSSGMNDQLSSTSTLSRPNIPATNTSSTIKFGGSQLPSSAPPSAHSFNSLPPGSNMPNMSSNSISPQHMPNPQTRSAFAQQAGNPALRQPPFNSGMTNASIDAELLQFDEYPTIPLARPNRGK